MADRRDILGKIESRLSLFNQAGGIPVVGAILSGALAYLTDLLDAWAPWSWFAAALVGAAAFQGVAVLNGLRRRYHEQNERIKRLTPPEGHLNPLETVFRNQRIYLNDLRPPLGKKISGKTFIDCELIGPMNIVFNSSTLGSGSMHAVKFVDCDGVLTDNNVSINNAYDLHDCSIRGCTIYNVSLFFPIGAYTEKPALQVLHWVNRSMISGED